jgi:membrane protease YdiL (CAAX protease family)
VAVMMVELSSVGLPLAVFLRLRGFNIGRALGLSYRGTAPLAGAVLMGAATVVVIPQFEAWQARLIHPPEEYLEALAEFISLKQGESVVWALVCLALVPALCEEALFRGILLKACLARWSKPLTIVGVGMVFGLFHLDLWRWPLLSVVGMLLTWTAAEAASLWPPIVFHLVNNSVSLLLANTSWSAEQDWVATTGDVPPGLFALGAGMLVLGAGLIGRNRGRDLPNNER